MKRRLLLLLAFFSVFLICSISFIPSAQSSIVNDDIEKEIKIFNESPSKLFLLILSIINMPLVFISIIVSIFVYLNYVPIMCIAYIYQNNFWEDNPLINEVSPTILVFIIFAIMLIWIGLPIIFMMGNLLYFFDFEKEDFSYYFKIAGRSYEDFISNLLRYGF